MARFLIDTSCIVAAVCAWHEHHHRATNEIERRLDRGEELVMATPVLVEAYAVLTRLPPPHRLSPADSSTLLVANFITRAVETAALEVNRYRCLVESAPRRDIAGGRIYDAVILDCGLAAKADVLLTFNERQFRQLTAQGIRIVVPLDDGSPHSTS